MQNDEANEVYISREMEMVVTLLGLGHQLQGHSSRGRSVYFEFDLKDVALDVSRIHQGSSLMISNLDWWNAYRQVRSILREYSF